MSNTIVVTGNVVKERPILTFSANNKAICRFAIADSRNTARPGEEANIVTQFFNVTVFGDLAQNIAEDPTIIKGTKLEVEGRFEQQKYVGKEDGLEKTSLVIIANKVGRPVSRYSEDGVSTATVKASSNDDDDFLS